MCAATVREETMDNLKDWEYVKQGITMWLNNMPKAAEDSFKDRPSSVHIVAGHTFISFMNAVISWETEKMNDAQTRLRELEKQCAGDVGWLKSVRSKLFGSSEPRKSLTETLEEQIILADSQLCLAILVSLGQDIGGFVKGGWLLRKAWKVYQHTYQQIYQLYSETLDSDGDMSLPQAPLRHQLPKKDGGSGMRVSLDLGTPSSTDWTVPNSTLQSPDDSKWSSQLEALRKSKTTTFELTDPFSEMASSESDPSGSSGSVKKSYTTDFVGINSPSGPSGSSTESLEHGVPFGMGCSTVPRERLTLDLNQGKERRIHVPNGMPPRASTSWRSLTAPCEPGPSERTIHPEDIHRLMGAISFGYGVFQLSISLLPPSLLKLISFLGFEGDRAMGIACLSFSRQSNDMRAPLATLALLWYYTIVTPFFALDGSNLSFEISAAQELIDEANGQFSKSSLFLFFRGRVERLKSNIQDAIRAYELAYRSSAQREIKLLCLHEIGWCRLIQLDFGTAMKNFNELKLCSQFSKSFYSYLTAICEGSFGQFSNLVKWRTEILELINRSPQKESQIERYIFRRSLKLPRAESGEQPKYRSTLYWKYLVFEMLFLWNTLSSCNEEQLESMIADCSQPTDAFSEPMVGISRLILGACLSCLARYDEAIRAFRECIAMREKLDNQDQQDTHISAFAYYELAVLLLRQQQHGNDGAVEAHRLLMHAQQTFKNYDFDNRVSVRIHTLLKRLD
ncbi:tetratricopeptide repeat protein 39C-like [Anopheles funestus]|uniref:tetratricopeptide repeat protein 39C-like n=1 Tax=Anopheles funestus TaxID=62324 RepID=UPI0007D5E24F|nr:tetratricopeptide repeat protein 39C-like [Anopheles funestus]XP_049278687.1 tetratricopeptide repeat protein 39C-like [Anopheles funestus]XP_049278688.1 tetratricopeptide repeat protein 39C-like [Anopheles funestus]XP_049278689.1 tetratricopeptide repeat protein 39C-like [Anopheles funestus]XP_049278690.1 tetratricopeptide repeat protein 39C-like [Anopheles funestus]